VSNSSAMRVVLLSEVFCKGMGYLENMLPKYLARAGIETHVIATDLPPNYWEKSSTDTYKGFVKVLPAGTVESIDGYTVHIIGHRRQLGAVRLMGLKSKLEAIRPTVVQTMAAVGWIPLDAALLKASAGYKLFTGCHYHASVFPLAREPRPFWSRMRLACLATRTVPGRVISLASEKCYAISMDCADVAHRFFGVPKRKIEVSPLGVDTELFHPVLDAADAKERSKLRHQLGFSDTDIVCIYTGQFTNDKNPLLLAKAVTELRVRGEPYRGLFVGNGAQLQDIQKCSGCVTNSFVAVQELGKFFRAADIGVWPTQESLSMLDAASCGLPIVVNHTMTASERIDGNGATYRLNDLNDLVRELTQLKESSKRRRLGSLGSEKMVRRFGWEKVARDRLRDYQAVMAVNGLLPKTPENRPLPDRIC